MKKSFMTRALATGLSFAMAFSLSAATNVTTASAAAKKTTVTKLMKVSEKTVTEGKSVTTYMNSTATKKYRIKSHTETATAKKYISVVMTKSRKGLTITAKDGALAAVNLEKKGVNVKINFAPATTVAKVKKTAATKYVNLKVVVKAKPVEKLTMTAAATAVKEITLTFNKAVADTTVAKITVKKGNATPTFTAKWADDKKSVVLAMDSKLTKGTYDVTVSGLEKEDLTASVTVEDQKLVAFELISPNLVADPDVATIGSIQFKAVDQYGKNYAGVSPTITTSFGGKTSKPSTKATENSTVTVTDMSTALAIVGTKGTITIVDNTTGINLTSEITYVAAAKASKVEVIGVYNTDGKKVETMTAGDDASKYRVALKFVDQYDTDMAYDNKTLKDDLQITVVSGTTGVVKDDKADNKVTADGKTYYAVPLKETLSAGTFQITVVNKKVGLLGNLSFDVVPGTVIKSFSVSADSDIYAMETATLSYTAIDADGKEVTSYDVLKKAFEGGLPTGVEISKQKDGTAKLTYTYKDKDGNKIDVVNKDKTNHRGSDNAVLTFQLYSGKANIIVVNTNVRVNERRYFWEVTGVNADVVTAGIENTVLEVKAESFKIADQYGNTLSKDEINNLIGKDNTLAVTVKENKGKFETKGLTDGKATTINAKATTFGAIIGRSDSIKLNVKSGKNDNDDGYDLELSYANALKATDFAIKWNDDVTGTFCTSASGIKLKDMLEKFTVTGKVNGKTVTINKDNYEITALTGNGCLGEIEPANPEKTVDGKLTVTVRTTDSNNKSVATDVTIDFKASNANAKLTTIKANSADLTAITGGMKVADLAKAFDLKDQYGNTISPDGVEAGVEARVDILSDNKDADVQYNGKTSCTVKGLKTGDKISITLTKGDLTATREVTLQ